jgi:2-dehydro-3-deoxygluconokinase
MLCKGVAFVDIVSLGESMVEFFCEGPISQATTFRRSIGGDTMNTIIAASRLGSKCGYITRLAEDQFGEYLLNKWKSESIDVSNVKQVSEGFNGIYFISLLEAGQREFIYYRAGSAASTATPLDLNPEYIKTARILHTSGISQAISKSSLQTVERAIEIARKKKVKVSFDPNYRPRLWNKDQALRTYETVLPYVDILLADETYGALVNKREPEDMLDYFAEFKIPVIALKLGSKGVMLKERSHDQRGFGVLDVKVVDTTGAGDAFNGGFLHGICHDYSVDDAAILGTITAGLKVTGRGAVESLPQGKDVYELLKAIRSGKSQLLRTDTPFSSSTK